MAIDIEAARLYMTQEMRWRVADWLAEDRLPRINAMQQVPQIEHNVYERYGKRAIDVVVSLGAITVTLPINAVIGVVTYFDVGRPLLFMQERLGKDCKLFTVAKFRNMRDAYDERGELLPASERVTKWGKFVRKTSLDELLNFYSILKGDMSVIGPRPLVPQYQSRFSVRHMARFAVKPGLECPPRDGGVSLRTWDDQFENDVWYAEHVSFVTDCKMLLNLVRFALSPKNAAARGNAVRGDFMGYSEDGIAINLHEVPEEYILRAYETFGVNIPQLDE